MTTTRPTQRKPFGVRREDGTITSAHTSIWAAKLEARRLGEGHEVVIAQRGEWIRPEDAEIYR